MFDEWEFPPVPRLLPKPIGDDAATAQIREAVRKAEEHRLEEVRQQWPARRVELVKRRLKFLRYCARTPASKRSCTTCGYVYLMRCPSLGVYKIGKTEDMRRRVPELRRTVDALIRCHIAYRTPVDLLLLEGLLHRQFSHVHFPLPVSPNELFKLSQEEVDGFEATTAAIERHLLAVEILRLKARLSQRVAAVPEAE